ncbi:MAG: hypothetical protein NZ519_02160 [Bacteroidia bacterium]|nr:hypothetical protein [Bacteroidia bacterium]MDW8300900.1 hypothetical protein [Bacteroidia bacterium]
MGVPLWAFRLRSCPQGRRATGYVRNAPTLASARGTPKKSNYFRILIRIKILSLCETQFFNGYFM